MEKYTKSTNMIMKIDSTYRISILLMMVMISSGIFHPMFGKNNRSWFNVCIDNNHTYTDYKSVNIFNVLRQGSFLICTDERLKEPIYVEFTYVSENDRWQMEFHKIDKSLGLPKSIEVWLSSDYEIPKSVVPYRHIYDYFKFWILDNRVIIHKKGLFKRTEYSRYNYKYEFVDLSVLFLPKNFSERYPPVTPKRTNY